MALRLVPGLIGVFFLMQAIGWLIDPQSAARALGMPLLDGLGRSTQIGDLSALFLFFGAAPLVGAIRSDPRWLRPPAMLLAAAALMRALAWLLHDATFAGAFIAVELVTSALLFLAAWRLEPSTGGAGD